MNVMNVRDTLVAITEITDESADCMSALGEIYNLAMEALRDMPQDNTSPQEVNMKDLSPEAIQLAHKYIEIVGRQESGNFNDGMTPDEVNASRTMWHNRFIRALKECGVNVSNRLSTTELAEKIVRWIPE